MILLKHIPMAWIFYRVLLMIFSLLVLRRSEQTFIHLR